MNENHAERANQLITDEAWDDTKWAEPSEALTVALIHAVLELADAIRSTHNPHP